MSENLKRGEGAPNVFRFMQKDVNVGLSHPFRVAVDGLKGARVTEYHVTLNVHVFTHQGDAAVSCRLYRKDGGENDIVLANAEGTTTRIIVHTQTAIPAEFGFDDAIRLAVDILRDQEVALFPDESDEARAELIDAFEEAKGKLFADDKGDGEDGE